MNDIDLGLVECLIELNENIKMYTLNGWIYDCIENISLCFVHYINCYEDYENNIDLAYRSPLFSRKKNEIMK